MDGDQRVDGDEGGAACGDTSIDTRAVTRRRAPSSDALGTAFEDEPEGPTSRRVSRGPREPPERLASPESVPLDEPVPVGLGVSLWRVELLFPPPGPAGRRNRRARARQLPKRGPMRPPPATVRSVRLVPYRCEPVEVGLFLDPSLPFALEQLRGLGQDEGEGASRAPGLMTDGQFAHVDPGVDVPSALLGERPFEGPPHRILQERAERVAQVAGAAVGQVYRPVVVIPGRAAEPGPQPGGTVACEVDEAAVPA